MARHDRTADSSALTLSRPKRDAHEIEERPRLLALGCMAAGQGKTCNGGLDKVEWSVDFVDSVVLDKRNAHGPSNEVVAIFEENRGRSRRGRSLRHFKI